MALVAPAGELFQVRITVARCAGRKLHATVKNGSGMIHGAGVTLLALDLRVLSSQRVTGMIMRKDRSRLPFFRVVARGAWGGELIAVYVRMTRDAGGRHTEKSLRSFPLKHLHVGCCDVIPRMAGIAGDGGVLSIQRETGRCTMIELGGIKSHNLKIFAVVIAMTISTPFVCQMRVESPPGVHGSFNFPVAIETFVVRQSLPVRMARSAFADSFKLVMRAGKFAGGDLRLCNKRNESSKYQQYPACNHLTAPHIAKEKSGANVDKKNNKQDHRKREMDDMPVTEHTLKLFEKENPAMQDGTSSGDSHTA
jgi:hypothetical protein